MLNRARGDHLDYEPGHGWNCSNAGYYFARRKIEQITSQDIGSALRHLVFNPLGLASVRLGGYSPIQLFLLCPSTLGVAGARPGTTPAR